MAKKVALSRQERLAKLTEKIKATDMGGGGSAGFWSPPEGKSIIRILPEIKTMEYFYQTVGKHNFPPDSKKHCYCPKFTSEGQLECPVCDLVDDLYKAGGDNKELAGKLRNRKGYWMNIVVRPKANDKGGETTGPFIFTPGVTVFQQIATLISDPDYGDITDVNDGIDIVIERTGQKLETEYQVMPRRQSSPLAPDQETIDRYLEEAKDLTYVEVSDDPSEDRTLSDGHAVYVLPYDRLSHEMDLDGEESLEEDEEVEEEPAKKPAKTKAVATAKVPAKKAAKPPVIEDDDEEEDEDEEEEAEEEEEKPAKKPSAQAVVQQRMARRSIRK